MRGKRPILYKTMAMLLSVSLLASSMPVWAQQTAAPMGDTAVVSESETEGSVTNASADVGESQADVGESQVQSDMEAPVVMQAMEAAADLEEGKDYEGYLVQLTDHGVSAFAQRQQVSLFSAAQDASPEAGLEPVWEELNLYEAEDMSQILENVSPEEIAIIEPNYTRELYMPYPPTDPYYVPSINTQWGSYQFEAVKAQYTYQNDLLGEGVRIAVLDTAVYANHADLRDANIEEGYSTVTNAVGGKTSTPSSDAYHGTFVTSLIVGTPHNGKGIAGVAPKATIVPIQVFGSGLNTTLARVIKGIEKATELNVDVISMSLGGPNSATERLAVQAAVNKGILVVAASGNNDSGETSYPAGFDETISVGGVMPKPASYTSMSQYEYTRWREGGQGSQYNSTVDVVAPAGYLPGADGWGTYDNNSGTSWACPIVAALGAICKQIDPSINTAGFRELLQKNSDDFGVDGQGSTDGQLVRNNYYGYGLVNFERVIRYKQYLLAKYDVVATNSPDAATVTVAIPATDKVLRWKPTEEIDGVQIPILVVNGAETPTSFQLLVAEYEKGSTLLSHQRISLDMGPAGQTTIPYMTRKQEGIVLKLFLLDESGYVPLGASDYLPI